MTGDTAAEARLVEAALLAGRFRYSDERQLQDGIADALTWAGLEVRREVRLAPGERVDLMVGKVGIEVKVAGQPAAVYRQLRRYAGSGEVEALVLVTNRARHTYLPAAVDGIPLTVVNLSALL